MKRYIYFILLALSSLIALISCKNEELTISQQQNDRVISFSASMDASRQATRVSLEEIPDSLDLRTQWEEDDFITLFFVQGDVIERKEQTKVSDISNNGKECLFDAIVPTSINIYQPFDIYGFSGIPGLGATIRNGKIMVDVTPVSPCAISDMKAPVWFRAKDVTHSQQPIAVHFKSLGAYEVVHLKNSGNEKLSLPVCRLVPSGVDAHKWYYDEDSSNGNSHPFFDPVSETVENIDTDYSASNYPVPEIVAGSTGVILTWYMPNGNHIPALRLQTEDALSDNAKDAKDFPMRQGKAYHIYAEWDGASLTINDSISPSTDLPRITMTTTKAVGETIRLRIGAEKEDQADIWIDLNNNGVKDSGEAVTEFYSFIEYTIASQTITVYGKVEELVCSRNQLNNLDVSHNTNLAGLFCGDNQLSTLDVSRNINLESLFCQSNQLSRLDVTNNPNLKSLWCIDNQLRELDVSQNVNLERIDCYNNQLTTLNVTGNPELGVLYCQNNKLTELDITQNRKLYWVKCFNNQLTSLDLTNNTNLRALLCYNNQLTTLDVSNNTNLTELFCGNNQLLTVDVSNNTELTKLYCAGNQLSTLDVSRNSNLVSLYCQDNQLNSDALNMLYPQLPDISAITVGDYDKDWKKHLKVSGNPGAEASNTQIATDKGWICDVQGNPSPQPGGQGINPLSLVAEYNVGTDGKRFATSHSNDASGYFNWYQATGITHDNYNPNGENIAANFSGYHLPTLNEIKVMVPYAPDIFFNSHSDKNNVSENNVTLGGATRDYTSDFRFPGGGVAYALRFKGHGNGQLCAYRYERVGTFEEGNLTSHWKVTCRYLGSHFSGTVEDIARESYWSSNSGEDVTRIFPACGNKGSSGTLYDRGLWSGLWSATEGNASFGWLANFYSSGADVSCNLKDYAAPVRLVRDH